MLERRRNCIIDLIGHDISNIHQIVLGHLELTKEMMETDDHVDI